MSIPKSVRSTVWLGSVVLVLISPVVAPGAIAGPDKSPGMTPEKAETILSRVRPKADKGRANAQYNLGVIYANGYGVDQDWSKARKWYQKAADQHQAKAEQNLGIMYAKGQGVAVDKSQAVRWFGRAARDGQLAAQNNLAVMYARGEGIDQDFGQAAVWAARAMRGGNDQARGNLLRVVDQLPQRYAASNTVDVRSAPDTDTHIVSHLNEGDAVARLSENDGWSHVLLLDGYRLGWVKTSTLQDEQSGQETVSRSESDSAKQASNAGSKKRSGNSRRGHSVSGAAAKRVVAADSVNVHSRPARGSAVQFQVDSGDRATVERAWNGWMLATFPNGRKGWIAGYLLNK